MGRKPIAIYGVVPISHFEDPEPLGARIVQPVGGFVFGLGRGTDRKVTKGTIEGRLACSAPAAWLLCLRSLADNQVLRALFALATEVVEREVHSRVSGGCHLEGAWHFGAEGRYGLPMCGWQTYHVRGRGGSRDRGGCPRWCGYQRASRVVTGPRCRTPAPEFDAAKAAAGR